MTQEFKDLLTKVSTSDLVDSMGRLHRHRCHILDLVTPTPGEVLFGPAVTISYLPTCTAVLEPERYNFAKLFYEAIGEQPEGKVLVLASNGHLDTSLGGGTKLSRAQNYRLAGVLADGRLRDFDELARHDFVTYCHGEATKWGGDVVTPFQANVPVVFSNVGIFPGDYIYADSAGALVIPGSQVREVLEGAVRVAEEEDGYFEAIREESPDTPPIDTR